MDYLPNTMLKCAWEENCLASHADRYMSPRYISYYTRRLMRFSTVILNFGSADYRPLAKKEDWIWHTCHKHYHSQEEFATYDLLSKWHQPYIRFVLVLLVPAGIGYTVNYISFGYAPYLPCYTILWQVVPIFFSLLMSQIVFSNKSRFLYPGRCRT